MTSKPKPRPSRLRRAASLAMTVTVVACWMAFLRPAAFGGSTGFVIVAGHSMEPGLHTGDLVLTHRQGSYRPGDVVAFRIPAGETGAGATVIHRIIGGSGEKGWIMQGDNKPEPDLWRPTNEDVVGKRWLLIPRGGHLLVALRSPLVFALGAAVMVFLLVVMPEEEADDGPAKRTPCDRCPAT